MDDKVVNAGESNFTSQLSSEERIQAETLENVTPYPGLQHAVGLIPSPLRLQTTELRSPSLSHSHSSAVLARPEMKSCLIPPTHKP